VTVETTAIRDWRTETSVPRHLGMKVFWSRVRWICSETNRWENLLAKE